MKTQHLKHRFFFLVIILSLTFSFNSCGGDDGIEQKTVEDISGTYIGTLTHTYTSTITNTESVRVDEGWPQEIRRIGDEFHLAGYPDFKFVNGTVETYEEWDVDLPHTSRSRVVTGILSNNNTVLTFIFDDSMYIGQDVERRTYKTGTLTKQ